MTQPAEGVCGRCQQPRTLHPAKPEWGTCPALLCTHCWQRYAEARAHNDYVDWDDVFNNASDDQIARTLTTKETAR